MMRIHTVAAGGGSILHFDGARFRVGPESAGADPGPACYRRGGPLAVTDCNVMLGRIQPRFFPKVFGPNADQPLDGEIGHDGGSPPWPPRSPPPPASRRPPSKWPRGSSRSPSRTWPTRSSRSRCSAATTSPELSAVLLRRRRRSTCLSGSRRSRDPHDHAAPAGRCAVRLRHGSGQHPGAPPTDHRGAAGRRHARRVGAAAGRTRTPRLGPRYTPRASIPAPIHVLRTAAPALRGHRYAAQMVAFGDIADMAAIFADRAPAALRLRQAGQAPGHRRHRG